MPGLPSSLSFPRSLERQLLESHSQFKEKMLTHPRFRHRDLAPLLISLADAPGFEVREAGRSVENREIWLVKVGTGPKKVLLWSQMHGNEPTATMALLDLFHFLRGKDDGLAAVRERILSEITLYVLPMLNPDGAERYQRENALGIDLNRDARRLTSPEAQLLFRTCLAIKPDFGFNLHDQDYRHSVAGTANPATISFLAPPFDEAKTIGPSRQRAIQLIAYLYRGLQPHLPGRIGRWPDGYEPRAFGDTIQGMGISVVLLEAGGYPGDVNKQYVRQLTFVLLASGLHAIVDETYRQESLEWYEQIPENGPLLYDLIVRQVRVERQKESYVMDLGIMREEISQPGNAERLERGEIVEKGDLAVPYAYQILEAEGMYLQPAKIHPDLFPNPEAVTQLDLMALLRQGYLYLRVKEQANNLPITHLPVHLLVGSEARIPVSGKNENATFVLEKEGQPVVAVVNGFVHDLRQTELTGRYNSLVYVK